MVKLIDMARGSIAFLLIVVNTLFWVLFFLYPLALLKFAVPVEGWRKLCNRGLDGIATSWISVNSWNLAITNRIKWTVSGLENLKKRDWYLVLANHQSWSDILVLQKVFNRKIPFLKFFIKQELIWVPALGLAWWALDYPFMKRYSREFLEKHPELKGKDIEITRKACEKFKTLPVSVMNFVEGTRFTVDKRDRQKSSYRHLLKPRAAGTAFMLSAMGDYLRHILNVTIVYPGGARGLWEFLSGRVSEVRVRIESLPIPQKIKGDYFNDQDFQKQFNEWINNLWADKDRVIEEMQSGGE